MYPSSPHLGTEAVHLAIRDAPQDVLRLVAPDAEVERVQRGETATPRLRVLQVVDERVTDEDHVRLALLGLADEPTVLERGSGAGRGGAAQRGWIRRRHTWIRIMYIFPR